MQTEPEVWHVLAPVMVALHVQRRGEAEIFNPASFIHSATPGTNPFTQQKLTLVNKGCLESCKLPSLTKKTQSLRYKGNADLELLLGTCIPGSRSVGQTANEADLHRASALVVYHLAPLAGANNCCGCRRSGEQFRHTQTIPTGR